MDFLERLGIQEMNSGSCLGASQWMDTDGKESLESFNPATNERIASIALSTQKEYDQLIKNSQEAFHQWRSVPAPLRGELIRKIGNALRDYKDALGSLVSLEMGKIKQEGDGEVQEMIDMADFAVGQSRMLYGNTMHSERPQHRMYEQWHPVGIVGVITAFNFPVAVWAWNAFIAAIAGNTVIWKPSTKVPLCAIAVQHICNKVLNDNDYPSIFTMFISKDETVKENFVADKRIPLISFTGSCSIGRHVYETVAKRMGRCLLELGGNNAIIVDKEADLNLAIPAILFGAIGTAGQRCTSTRRLFVHESIEKELTNKLTHAYTQIRHGDPLDPDVLLGPLIDQTAVDSFNHTISEIRKAGGEILVGGETIKSNGHFVQPTLIRAENNWDIVQQETFAPILYLISYNNLEDAIAMQNDVPQGLSSAIFTRNLQVAEIYLSSLGSDCGIANVNIGTSGAEIGGAFGGEKETGGGREAGSDAWKAYMRRQTNTINWSNELPLAQGILFKLD
ncbi:MAG: aldehyde dehydrogenase family protein [Gammaproteobacteria bacterium]|nr:aldehyde dehydrogenase family protein [Gammaproteobacteria bacterium]